MPPDPFREVDEFDPCRIRIRFNRSVDGVLQPHTVNGAEDVHTLYMEARDGKLVIVDVDGEKLPPEKQQVFSKRGEEEDE